MKKEEVYKLIEYNGKYDDKVKRNLKKLLKKYHPDHYGKNDIIKVIYEVADILNDTLYVDCKSPIEHNVEIEKTSVADSDIEERFKCYKQFNRIMETKPRI